MSRAIKAFASSEAPVVIATYNNPKSVEIGSFVDEQNQTTIITNAKNNFKPFSPLSGNTLVSLSDATSEFDSNDIKAMKEIATCKCGAHLHTTEELAASLVGTRLHCVVCGEEVDVNEEINDDEVEDEVESSDAEESIDDVKEDDVEKTESSEDEVDEDEVELDDIELEESDMESEEEIDDVEDDEIEESSDEEEVTDPIEEQKDEELVEESESTNVEQQEIDEENGVEEASDEDKAEEGEQLADETNANADDENVESDDENEEESTEDVTDEEISASVKKRITLNLFDNVKASTVDLVKVRDESKYYLMSNYKPVATLNKENASEEVQSFFDNEANMRAALGASLDNGFTKEVCASFGITPMRISFRASKAVRQEIAKIKSKLANEALANVENYKKRFAQAVSIASVGVNKSIYGSNILRDALAKQCVLAGMVDAEDLVNEMFAKYGEDYIKEIIEKAKELVEKSDEARNAEASVVANASFNCTVSKSVAKRLGSHIPVESKVMEAETVKSNGYSKLF